MAPSGPSLKIDQARGRRRSPRIFVCRPLTSRRGPSLRIALIALLLALPAPAHAAESLFAERQPLCLSCHGEQGVSPTDDTPSLGGMPEYYALLQLVEFRDGNRQSDIM